MVVLLKTLSNVIKLVLVLRLTMIAPKFMDKPNYLMDVHLKIHLDVMIINA